MLFFPKESEKKEASSTFVVASFFSQVNSLTSFFLSLFFPSFDHFPTHSFRYSLHCHARVHRGEGRGRHAVEVHHAKGK